MTIPDGGVSISFQSSPTMAAGTYSTIVRGEAGSLAASANVALTVKTATGSVHIQRVEPSHVMVGVPVGSVTLEGVGFTGASVVLFDGAPVATFDNGANSLDFEPPNSSWLVAQIHTVQVSDPTNGKSNIATYEVYAPQPGPDLFVGQLTQYMSESLIMNSLVPDLNGDGRADLVMVTLDPNQSLYIPVVRYGQADGTFSAATSLESFTPQASTTMVLTGDFNGDGYTDLILVSNQASASASYQVLLNDGTGHFSSGGTGPLPNSSSFGVPGAVGDFNHDGKLDFAFGSSANGQTLSLLYGNGDGTFAAPVAFGATGGVTYLISASDLNGDGYTDLVYAYSLSAGNQIRMLLSGSGGSFTDTQIAGLPSPPAGFVIGDFNNDHVPDIFAVDSSGIGQAYLGAGNGTFKGTGKTILASDLYLASPPFVSGDFDHDGNLDVATRTQLTGPDEILFLFGDGKGGFTRQSIVSDHSFTLQVGDVNGDGIADIFGSGDPGFSYSSVVLGRDDRNYPSAQVLLSSEWGDLSSGNVFGDGFMDLLVAGSGNGGAGSVSGTIYHFQSDGTFKAEGQAPEYATLLVDLDGDGIADMVGFTGTGLIFWKGDGSGVFTAPINQITLPNGSQPIYFRDMDGDGHMDIVAPMTILYGKGDFQFDAVPWDFYENFVVGDFDGDHIPDIATPSGILFGQGNRTFTAPTGITPLQNSVLFPTQAVGDINGDGMDDLVLGPDIYLSAGRSGFKHDQSLMVNGYSAGISSIAVADFNGDGLLDIAVGLLPGGEDVVLFTNDGTGKYQVRSYTVGLNSVFTIATDLNRDGTPDLAFRGFLLDFVPPTVTVLLHK